MKKLIKKPRYSHYTEFNALRAGESAFKARILFDANPYHENPYKSSWIRGWKRAERAFFDAIQKSKAIQSTLEYEEVEA